MSQYQDDAYQEYSTCSKVMWCYFVSVMASLFRTLSAVTFSTFWCTSACCDAVCVCNHRNNDVEIFNTQAVYSATCIGQIFRQYFHRKYKISTTAHDKRCTWKKKNQHHKWQRWVKYVMLLKMFLSCWQCTVRVVPQVGEVYSKLRVPVSVEDRRELVLQGLCLPYWGRRMLGNCKTHSSCGHKVVPWPVGGTWETTQLINFWPSRRNDSATLIIKQLN